jgi:gliding motility-associated-like protein
MLMKTQLFSILLLPAFLISVSLSAQQSAGPVSGGMSGGACLNCVQVQNGSGVLGEIYRRDTCGLNYVTASEKVSQRVSPPGPVQPITVAISGMPSCAIIERAFVWADASGTGVAININITNPAGNTGTFPMTLIGSGQDKCWGYAGTHSYRADIPASAIAGNGNYVFSGFPVGATDDVDGFTFMIIYRDPAATWEGHIVIKDGAIVQIGSNSSDTIFNLNVCDTSVANERAFMAIGDLQNVGSAYLFNNGPLVTYTEDWWDFFDGPTSPFWPSQTQSIFTVASSGDCYNIVMTGIYYQTANCNVCVPQPPGTLSLQTTGTSACPGGTMSATTTPTSGNPPYSYLWQPGGQTTPTINNLTAGTYTVYVTDGTGCSAGTDTVTVTNHPAPIGQFALSPSPTASYPGQLCFNDQTPAGAAWLWQVDTATFVTSSACYTLTDTGNICVQLIVTDANGCLDTVVQCVRVLGEGSIWAPNVFTPNGDGNNDVFLPTWQLMASIKCTIYDRWGMKMYEWDGLTGSWDGRSMNGKEASDGVYYYVIDAVDLQGTAKNLTGFVHLIRPR